jgi:hypothetical protein
MASGSGRHVLESGHHLFHLLQENLGGSYITLRPDVWMGPGLKTSGEVYWQYVISYYVDDICGAMEKPEEFMKALGERVTLKEGSVKEPDIYLGADVKKYYIEGSDDPEKARWAMSSTSYVKPAIAVVERELVKIDKSSGYRPELDSTPELNAE